LGKSSNVTEQSFPKLWNKAVISTFWAWICGIGLLRGAPFVFTCLRMVSQGGLRPLGGVDEPIRIFVEKLKDLGLLDTQVGIQFIRFGNDERGMERLQKLDSDLHLPMDIVDTTPWDGNVWKMLLGAIDRDWDDDEE